MSSNHRPRRFPRSPFATLSLVVPANLVDAMERLAELTDNGGIEAEWLRATDEYLVRVYRLVKAHPDNPVFPDPTGRAIPAFVDAVEAYLKQSRQWPLRDML